MATMKTLNGYGFNATELNGKTSDSYLQLGADETGSTGAAPTINAGTFGGMTVGQFVDMIYPVGSIYMSVSNTSPETLFGGTWESIGGRFLLGADATYAAGSVGGEAVHKLTIAEMPDHSHNVRTLAPWGKEATLPAWSAYATDGTIESSGENGKTDKFWEYTLVLGEGSGAAHNNMPPYLAVYMWKRTA